MAKRERALLNITPLVRCGARSFSILTAADSEGGNCLVITKYREAESVEFHYFYEHRWVGKALRKEENPASNQEPLKPREQDHQPFQAKT